MNNSNNTNTIMVQSPIQATHTISRKIGSTTYEVHINFSKTSNENMNDKIVRLIKNEALNISNKA